MIEIIDICSQQIAEADNLFRSFKLPKYPVIEPDDVLFVYSSGPGSQGEIDNYLITYTGKVYRVSV